MPSIQNQANIIVKQSYYWLIIGLLALFFPACDDLRDLSTGGLHKSVSDPTIAHLGKIIDKND